MLLINNVTVQSRSNSYAKKLLPLSNLGWVNDINAMNRLRKGKGLKKAVHV